MRVAFNTIFQSNPNGSFTPKTAVRIGGVTMGTGVSFSPGVAFSGVDIAKYAGHDLDVDREPDGTVVIKAVFS